MSRTPRTPNRTSSGLPPIRSRRTPTLRVVGGEPLPYRRVALFKSSDNRGQNLYHAVEVFDEDIWASMPEHERPKEAVWLGPGVGWAKLSTVGEELMLDLADITVQQHERWRMTQAEKGPKAKRERLRH
jgi:hypothetical protein